MTTELSEATELSEPLQRLDRELRDRRFRPSALGWTARMGFMALLLGFLFSVALWVPYEFQADLVSYAAVFALVGLSMNVLLGYQGLLSLGHQAFFGIGAFASALVTGSAGLPFLAGLLAAAGSGAAAAFLLGGVALRIRGLYLAIVTLAYGLIAQETLFNLGRLPAGVPAPKPAYAESPRAYALLCLIVLVLAYVFDVQLMRSKVGRGMLAVRTDERVAASFGIPVTKLRLLAFVISGVLAGLAGGLFAHLLGLVTSAQFTLTLGITFVLMTILGGLGNRGGIVVAAAFFALMDELASLAHEYIPFFPRPNPLIVPIVGSALLVLTLIKFPGGIGQQLQPIQRWVRGGRFDPHAMKEHDGSGGGIVGRP